MAGRIKGITVEIGGDTTGLEKALKAVNSTIKSTQSELKDVNKLLKLDPSNTELLSQKQKLLKDAVSATKEKLDALKDAQAQAKQQLENGELGRDKYDALQREIIETEQELKRLQEQVIESNAALAKIEEIGGKLESVGNKMSGVGQKLLPVTAGVAALGTAAVKTTADFDSSMSQVQATMGITSDAMSDLNGESVNTMDSLRDLAKQMGSKTAFSASECADAMNYLALAGYDTQEIYNTLPTVLNLAASGGIDLASASDMVTDAMSALGMETSQADTMVDQMAKTASSTNTSVAQLGEGILTIGATAKSIKGGTAELNTALGILANNGIKGAEGGTHLRNVILSLQNPTDKAADQMEALGVSVYDSEGNMRSMNDILGDLNTSMDGMTAEEKSNIISKIFNKTDLSAVNALLANTGDTWDDLQQSIIDSGGAAQQMADTQLDDLSGQLTILKSALEGLAISFGEILMPMVRSAIEKIQAFVDKLNSLDDVQKQTIVRIAAVAAAIGPLLIVLGKTISTVGSTMTAFSSLTKGIAKLGVKIAGSSGSVTSLGTALGAVAGPVLAVVAVVGTLVAAFVTLWNTNEDFRNAVIGILEGIKAKFEEFGEAITSRLNALGFDFGSVVEVLKTVWMGFCDLLAPVFEAAFKVVSSVLGTILDIIVGLLDVFIGLFTGNWSQMWEGIKEIFSGVWEGIKSILSAALEMIKGIADTVLGWFGTNWANVWNSIKNFFERIWDGITTFFTSVWENIKAVVTGALEMVKNTITNAWNAVTSVFTKVWNNLTSLVSTAWETIKNVVQLALMAVGEIIHAAISIITLPFQFIWENCKDIILAAWEAIKKTVGNALSAVESAVTTGWNAVKTVISTVLSVISTAIYTVWNTISSTVSSVVNTIKNTVTNVWNAIKTALAPILESIKTAVSTSWNSMSTTISTVVNAIKTNVTTVWNAIKSTVTTVVTGIKTAVSTAWEGIKSSVSTILNSIKSTVSTIWNGIQTSITTVVNSIKSSISSAFSSIQSTATSMWNSIKNAITTPITNAKNTVSSMIDAIKSKFNFSWSLPHLSLPHLSISGSFSINPPSVPHFSISWYKKAMDGGMILDSPTIFGMKGNNLLAGGEAGSETVVGTHSLMDMIQRAVEGVSQAMTINYGGVTINVYGAEGQDISALADEIEDRINENAFRRRAAFI